MSLGVPIKILDEAEGHIVTCETKTGEVYRGKLIEAEDNMNCHMANVHVTYRDGRSANLESIAIRGSEIRFIVLPEMLENAPMFTHQGRPNIATTAGRGRSAILRAQVSRGRDRGRGRGRGRGRSSQRGRGDSWQPGTFHPGMM